MKSQVYKKAKKDYKLTPIFLDPKELQKEQITDPDYRLKFLEKLYGEKYQISCSRCHHCR